MAARLPTAEADRLSHNVQMRTVFLILLLSACSRTSDTVALEGQERPPVKLVQRLEARLAQESCVRPLSRWRRRYSYPRTGGIEIDKQRVWIDFTAAGFGGEKAGMSIEPPPPAGIIEIDDRETGRPEAAYGDYDAHRDTIRWWCDANDKSPRPQSLYLKL